MLPTRLAGVAALLLAAAPAAQAAESAVLLAATAPGYAPGMVIDPQERLRLPDGASVTLLLRSGQMLKLRGPLETSLDRAEPARPNGSAAALAEAFRLRGVDATAIGGTRAAALGKRMQRAAAEVSVELERSGTWCVAPTDTLWLMRPVGGPAEFGLRRRGSLRRLAWPPGAARVEWPGDLPIEDGDSFDVLADGQVRATLTFRLRTGATGQEPTEIAQGVLLGCHAQHEAALRRLARAHLPPDLWLSTERGRTPTYAPGERIGLTAMADADGWLYCVTTQSDGAAIAVFPASAAGGARLAAGVPASLPGDRHGIALPAGPRGVQRVQCWLADRDAGPDLPDALRGAAVGRLPDGLAPTLDTIFAGMAGQVARASLDIRVD
ncbi:DUF4384 domain-containing protein [Paracraurococcus ruber]|nr:DUF4384 domain-containing protein [Paracraurococcus ruber]